MWHRFTENKGIGFLLATKWKGKSFISYTGLRKWSNTMNLNSANLAKQFSRENKLKVFHYKYSYIERNMPLRWSNETLIVYIEEQLMKTPSNIPLVTVNFQKLSNEELFNDLIMLIILINIRLLKKPYSDFYPSLQLLC